MYRAGGFEPDKYRVCGYFGTPGTLDDTSSDAYILQCVVGSFRSPW